MAVFRVEKTKDFTIMSNHHLRNTELSLKAKGLLSLMLSLPEDWDYTTKGLAHICKPITSKGIAASVEAAYPKGTDAPALYSWRYAGKFSARAGTPDR